MRQNPQLRDGFLYSNKKNNILRTSPLIMLLGFKIDYCNELKKTFSYVKNLLLHVLKQWLLNSISCPLLKFSFFKSLTIVSRLQSGREKEGRPKWDNSSKKNVSRIHHITHNNGFRFTLKYFTILHALYISSSICYLFRKSWSTS